MMSVRDLPVGRPAALADLRVPPAQRARLAELGLRPGEQVEVVQRAVGGARILAVHGARIALDAHTAARLHVRVADR